MAVAGADDRMGLSVDGRRHCPSRAWLLGKDARRWGLPAAPWYYARFGFSRWFMRYYFIEVESPLHIPVPCSSGHRGQGATRSTTNTAKRYSPWSLH